MADNDIMAAGIRKVKSITIYPKGIEGEPEVYEDVKSWRLGYNGILTIKGDGWTELLAQDMWNWIHVTED